MRYLLIILFIITASCGTDANECPELTFIQRVSYQDFVSYRFEDNTFYTSDKPLDLKPGKVYHVCTKDNEIISISD